MNEKLAGEGSRLEKMKLIFWDRQSIVLFNYLLISLLALFVLFWLLVLLA